MSEFNKFRWHEVAMVSATGISARVAGVMFDRANMDGTEVYMNNETLARKLRCNEKSIRRALANLTELELVAIVVGENGKEKKGHHFIGGGSSPSVYYLTMPTQVDIAPQVDKAQVTPQVDIYDPGKHAGQSTSGHSPHKWTSVSAQVDTSVHLIDPGNRPGLVSNRWTSEMSTDGASLAIDGSDSQESEPPRGVSSSTDESEAMNFRNDPWENSTGPVDPFASTDEDYYGALADAHAEASWQPETFRPGPSQFVGADTDPSTGGPNWGQGPRQLA